MSVENTKPFSVSLNQIEHSTQKSGCIGEAFALRERNNNLGAVYYVWIPDRTLSDMPFLWGHAYYIKDLRNEEDIALNQADNGFEGYPKLTVKQVKNNGVHLTDITGPEVREILNIFNVLTIQKTDPDFWIKNYLTSDR